MEGDSGVLGSDLDRVDAFAQIGVRLDIRRAALAKQDATDKLVLFLRHGDAVTFDEAQFPSRKQQTDLVGERFALTLFQAELP